MGNLGGLIQVYSESLSLLNSFQAHTHQINRIKQSPFNSNYVATCSNDFIVKLWNTTTSCWTLIRTYTNHTQAVLGLEWINEDTIASGSNDLTIKIWSIVSGQTNRTISTYSGVRSLKLLSNGFYLACGLGNGNINIYDINNNGSLISTLVGHWFNTGVNDLILLSDDLLASSSGDHTIRIWNLTTNSTKFILQGHTVNVNGLKFISSDVLASGSNDKTIQLWNITNGQSIRTLTGHNNSIWWSVDLLNSQTLASGSGDQTIKIWNTTTGECLNSFTTGLYINSLTVLTSIERSTSKNHLFFYPGFKTALKNLFYVRSKRKGNVIENVIENDISNVL
jgi:WD40 repeat protein